MGVRVLKHIVKCSGTITCKVCGRRGCIYCIRTRVASRIARKPETQGMCLICSGIYKEDEILLYPPKESVAKGWDA